jgi:HSP20 family molecular chaperone IbpA
MNSYYTMDNDPTTLYPGQYNPQPYNIQDLLANKGLNKGTSPLINTFEFPDHIKVEMVMPGLKREDFAIFINEHDLIIFVMQPVDPQAVFYEVKNYNFNSLMGRIPLPEDIDTDFIKTVYEDGLLKIYFPKLKGGFSNRKGRIVVY